MASIRLFFAILLLSHITHCQFPIKNVVVLVQENRSFDHFLGWLKRQNPAIDGLDGTESNPYNPYDPKSPLVHVSSSAPDVDPNAGHQVTDTTQQVFGGSNLTYLDPAPMNGFVANAESIQKGWGPLIMSGFNISSLPVINTLAMEFAVFDKWHASIPGPTEVNRAFIQSATSDGFAYNDEEELAVGFPQKTLMESFLESGYEWYVWYAYFPTALFMRNLREHPLRFKSLDDFYDACSAGTLPTYSFVEPLYYTTDGSLANDQHPSHEASEGDKLIKQIYLALRNSPQWNSTAFIITYDEHGGYYDHVSTPLNVPNPDGKVSQDPPFDFKRLGVRVPTVIVSPWINKGTVVTKPTGPTPTSEYEHSSIAATMKKMFNLTSFLTERDKWAGTFEHIFLQRDSPRTDCPTDLPDPPTIIKKPNQADQPLNDLQLNMVYTTYALNNYVDDISSIKTEREGATYCAKRVQDFLQKKQEEIAKYQQ